MTRNTASQEGFHYNLDLEMTLRNLFGNTYRGWAGSAKSPTLVRKAMMHATWRLRQRLHEIVTLDERLELATNIALDKLEQAVKELSPTSHTEWDIIASLLLLVTQLLGYDWVDGEVHRHVIFFRDRSQENFDHRQVFPPKDPFLHGLEPLRMRYATINHLQSVLGLNVNAIARIMGLSEYFVRMTIKRISAYEKREKAKFPTLELLENIPLLYEDSYRKDAYSPVVHWGEILKEDTKSLPGESSDHSEE